MLKRKKVKELPTRIKEITEIHSEEESNTDTLEEQIQSTEQEEFNEIVSSSSSDTSTSAIDTDQEITLESQTQRTETSSTRVTDIPPNINYSQESRQYTTSASSQEPRTIYRTSTSTTPTLDPAGHQIQRSDPVVPRTSPNITSPTLRQRDAPGLRGTENLDLNHHSSLQSINQNQQQYREAHHTVKPRQRRRELF